MSFDVITQLIDQGIARYGGQPGFFACQSNWGIDSEPKCYMMLEPVAQAIGFLDRSEIVSADAAPIESFETCFGALDKLSSFDHGGVPYASCFLNYELLHAIENVPNRQVSNETQLYCGFIYRRVVEISSDGAMHERRISFADFPEPFWKMGQCETVQGGQRPPADSPTDSTVQTRSSFTKQEYLSSVNRIRSLIRKGEVYQVNLTQMFSGIFPETFVNLHAAAATVWRDLVNSTLPSYGAFACLAPNRFILSASPELFLRAHAGNLFSSPIKGTCKRGPDPDTDICLSQTLLASEKNLAELAMIVDLIRNDMSRVALLGSVEVLAYPRLETLPYVHHLVGDVCSSLKPGVRLVEILNALFPCGSITGAPKVAAMRYLNELEPSRRGIYTGAIGIIAGQREFQFNVAIRTLEISSHGYAFGAGGGIVFDSDAEDEYEESLAKASPIRKALYGVSAKGE